jgi:hypothetical protein
MARFFISHSADSGTPARAVLEAIRDQLEVGGHKVFVDERIRPGERWRAKIYDELARCDAAIVILDESALQPESYWVRREVYNLLWRQYLGAVEIRGVMLSSVDAGQVRRAGYGELVELQLHLPMAADEDAGTVAARVVAEFGTVRQVDDDPMRRWVDEVVDLISKVNQGPTLNRFARALGVSEEDLGRIVPPDCYRFLAHQLIGEPTPEEAFDAVDAVMHILGTSIADLAIRVLPALVNGQAARVLLRRDDPRRVVVLNAKYATTAELYVMRAACAARTYRYVQVSARVGPDFEAEFTARCRVAIARLVRWQENPHGQAFLDRLKHYRTKKVPGMKAGFLIIDPAGAEMADIPPVIEWIRGLCPWLTVVVLTGPALPEPTALDSWQLGEVLPVDPPLSEGYEMEMDPIRIDLSGLSGRRAGAGA